LALSGTQQAPRSGNLLLRIRDEQPVRAPEPTTPTGNLELPESVFKSETMLPLEYLAKGSAKKLPLCTFSACDIYGVNQVIVKSRSKRLI
jgi:hypothetical protein